MGNGKNRLTQLTFNSKNMGEDTFTAHILHKESIHKLKLVNQQNNQDPRKCERTDLAQLNQVSNIAMSLTL